MRMRWKGGKDAVRVVALRRRIERWRRTRAKRTRMPEQLWTAAADLAREHGVHRIARAVGVGYEGLRDRLDNGRSGRSAKSGAAGFVELNGAALLGGVPHNVVELCDRDGRRLVIRLAGAVDVAEVMATFLGRPS